MTNHLQLVQLLQRIGYRTFDDPHFDTDAAGAVERRIRLELAGRC